MILSRSGTVRIEFEVLASDREVLGMRLDELVVPRGVRIAQLNRGLRSFPPDAEARVRAGDVLILLADLDREPALRTWILEDRGHREEEAQPPSGGGGGGGGVGRRSTSLS